jgi:hypothetical protein
MKRWLLLPVLAPLVLFFSSYVNHHFNFSPSSDEGKLSYTVDGKKVVVNRPAITIYLNEVSHNTAKGSVKIRVTIFPAGELFDFLVAEKGTTNIVHYKPSFGENKVEAVYLSPEGHNYYGDHVSVNISSLDGTHVSGTFSGTFTAEGKTKTVTDGSFDLPMQAKR